MRIHCVYLCIVCIYTLFKNPTFVEIKSKLTPIPSVIKEYNNKLTNKLTNKCDNDCNDKLNFCDVVFI